MKRFLLSVVLATTLVFTSCKFDDSDIWDTLNKYGESIRDHEQRISALEELCKQMNTNIEALQTIVAALEKRDYVTNVSEVRSNGEVIGYTISFAYSDTVTIYHGKDGKDGQNGANGKDGYTPQIGVMKDTDGIYYWTLDGEWMLDGKGNKIQANGVDGTDGTNGSNGTNGANGVTPQLKIENDYWYVSYDNGATWEKLGKATGDDGIDGDSLFKKISIGEGFVIFTLNDGKDTQINIPFTTNTKLCISLNKAGELQNHITIEEQRSVTSLQINGRFNKNDLIFINTYLRTIEILDLSGATYEDNENLKLNPLGEIAANRTLRHIIIGNQIKNDILDGALIDPSYCIALETLTMTTNHSRIAGGVNYANNWPNHLGVRGTPNLSKLVIAEGVTELAVSNDSAGDIYCICPIIELPSTLTIINYHIFGLYCASTVFCNAKTPPCIHSAPSYPLNAKTEPISEFYDAYKQMQGMTLYVPAESVNTYKSTPGWSQFGTILPIE